MNAKIYILVLLTVSPAYVMSADELPSDPTEILKQAASAHNFCHRMLLGSRPYVDMVVDKNEILLTALTWIVWYKLRNKQYKKNAEWLHKEKKRKHKHRGLFECDSASDTESELPSDIQELLAADKAKHTIPTWAYEYSVHTRTYIEQFRHGLEIANVSRALALFEATKTYVGISNPTDNDLEYTPLVRYFEVAGTTADAEQLANYAYKKIKKSEKAKYMHIVADPVQHVAKRVATGAAGVFLTTCKNNYMDPEEILTYRAIELATRAGKEYIELEPDNHVMNNMFDSVQEAAQRKPYWTMSMRAAKGESRKSNGIDNDEYSTVTKVIDTVVDIGADASVRFAGKEAAHYLGNTQMGKEVHQWVDERVPKIVQEVGGDIAKELVVAGVVGVGKYCAPSYGASCVLL